MTSDNNKYPHLADLLSGWFHADFDIEGDTIEAIITAFTASSTNAARQAVIGDIKRFLAEHAHAVDADFVSIFQPDIIATAFAPSTQAFLLEISRHLENHQP